MLLVHLCVQWYAEVPTARGTSKGILAGGDPLEGDVSHTKGVLGAAGGSPTRGFLSASLPPIRALAYIYIYIHIYIYIYVYIFIFIYLVDLENAVSLMCY